MSVSVNELKVLLFLEQNLNYPILEYFDPLLYLHNSPVFLTDSFRESVKNWYVEKIRTLNMIDVYYLSKLNDEVSIRNDILDAALQCEYAKNKLKIFSLLEDVTKYIENKQSSIDYFLSYPNGRCININ